MQDINNDIMYMVYELICGKICHYTFHFNVYTEFLSFFSDFVALLDIILYFVQKDNTRNQRENVILALANAQARLGLAPETEPVSNSVTLQYLPIFFSLILGIAYSIGCRVFILVLRNFSSSVDMIGFIFHSFVLFLNCIF